MKLRDSYGLTVDFRTVLWVSFWLYLLQAGDPDLLTAIIGWIGRL